MEDYWKAQEEELLRAMRAAAERYRRFSYLHARAPTYRAIQLGSPYARALEPSTVHDFKPYPGDEWSTTAGLLNMPIGNGIIICLEREGF